MRLSLSKGAALVNGSMRVMLPRTLKLSSSPMLVDASSHAHRCIARVRWHNTRLYFDSFFSRSIVDGHKKNCRNRAVDIAVLPSSFGPFIMLRVTEIFRSIQGESTHAGRPCTFVRLTGCPMRCVWCDSEYTFTGGESISIDDVMEKVDAYGCRLVEVTGGEPLAQREAFELISRLCNDGYEVLIETGGYVSTEDVDMRAKIILDVKCPTSGEDARNHWANLERLRADVDEVKFVIADRRDWDYAKKVIVQYDLENRAKAVLVSPVWGDVSLPEVAEWIGSSRMNVRMQLQMHKQIWGAEARGV